MGARGSLVVKELGYKPEGRGFETRWGEILNLPNPSGRTRSWASDFNRNEYRKIKKKCFWGVKCGWCVGLITLPSYMSWLSRHCGILNISQPCKPPRPVTGIALLFLFFFQLGKFIGCMNREHINWNIINWTKQNKQKNTNWISPPSNQKPKEKINIPPSFFYIPTTWIWAPPETLPVVQNRP
jgi:hypothetical protein